MAPLVLEGGTLGERQKHYNQLLKEFLATNHEKPPNKICHDDADIDNFLKIDVANHNRNVDFIFEVFKCKDLLYITRAIKKSTWLITDDKYAHIINPEFLHTELFPFMMTKAKKKLVSQIRLHLKDATRVKSFYKYYKESDLNYALKWLPRCPIKFLRSEVAQHANCLSSSLLQQLCRKDPYVLNIIQPRDHRVQAAKFLLKKHTKECLDVLDLVDNSCLEKFSNQSLKVIMKVCANRLLENFSHYVDKIDYPTFFKHMDKQSLKQFLLKCSENKDLRGKFTHEHFKFFLQRLEAEDRIEVLKVFYCQSTLNVNCEDNNGLNLLFSAIEQNIILNSSSVYRWYQCMPFNISFPAIKKLVRMELKSDQRHSMLSTLLVCAERNLQDVYSLLRYYHDHHINEAYVFKIEFINNLLSSVDTYRFSKEMWVLLENLFGSMEVYINSSLGVQKCIESIIVYKIVNDGIIPEIIEKKLEFNTFQVYQTKLNEEEKNKLFEYLYNLTMKKVENESSGSNSLSEKVQSLEQTLNLLVDWNKNLLDYPIALSKVKEFANVNELNHSNINLSSLYNVHKPWRKYMIEESFQLSASEEVIVNALRYDASLLTRNSSKVDVMRNDNNMFLKKVLSLIKTYWTQTLAKDWESAYLSRLQENGNQIVIKSLAILLPQKKFIAIAKQNIPDEKQIDWKETTELEYNLRKNIALNIHLARPLPDTEVVLLFTKGDYLQYALISLNIVLSSISERDKEKYVQKLLMAPLALQQHGIYMAFDKLNDIEKLIPIFEILSKQNSSNRTLLFTNIRKLLCKEKRKSTILKLWKFLNILIDNMCPSESDSEYKTLAQINDISLIVRTEYCIKVYLYFKNLPPKLALEYTCLMLKNNSVEMVEILDCKFIEDVVLTSIYDFSSAPQELIHLLVIFLLSADNKEIESDRYYRYVHPLLSNPDYYNSANFNYLLEHICNPGHAFSKNKVLPVMLFKSILYHCERKSDMPKNYVAITAWKLKYIYIKLLDNHRSGINISSDYLTAVMPQFGAACLGQLQKDVALYFPSIYLLFQHSLSNMFQSFAVSKLHQLVTFKHILAEQEFLQSYLLVHKMMPPYCFGSDEKVVNAEVIEMLCTQPAKEFRMICHHYYAVPVLRNQI